MKADFRKQTFSKPGKPSDEEIKQLTGEDAESPAQSEVKEPKKTVEAPADITNNTKPKTKTAVQTELLVSEKTNPFLLSRGQTSGITVEKTGYRLRSDYMDLLKLVKRMKKGHTLEAVLDDALTFYFENSEDGRKAVKHQEMLEAE